jgi:hypothetical protein
MKVEIAFVAPGCYAAAASGLVATASTQADALRALAATLAQRDGWTRPWSY